MSATSANGRIFSKASSASWSARWVADRGLAIVVAAQDPQGAERVSERRVLGFVLLEQVLLDGRAGLV